MGDFTAADLAELQVASARRKLKSRSWRMMRRFKEAER
jgi:hypothetical protein